MGADLVSENTPENDPDDHQDSSGASVNIPSQRPAMDDHIENLPKIGSSGPVWCYDQPQKRGHNRRYWGQVEEIGGVEGERLRARLAAAIRDLLEWANQRAERDSREHGGVDDGPA